MTDTAITLTHEGKTYTAEDERGGGHPCAGCAFHDGPVRCSLPIAHPGRSKCTQQDIIWVEQPQQESPLDMPGFKAQKAYNGCDGCCGNPATCEQPCFHSAGRTTPGTAGAIARKPDEALEAMADNAREIGLGYEPSATGAEGFLEEAAQTMRQRGRQYDNGQERSMGRVIKAFNAITGHDLKEADGWLLMIVLKLVRDQKEHPHRDSLVDAIAYSALRAECQMGLA